MPPTAVLVILYPGAIFHEIYLIIKLLQQTHRLHFVTPDGQAYVSEAGIVIKATSSYVEAPLDHCAVLIPGGDPGSVASNQDLMLLLQRHAQHEALFAAICAGPILLDIAGISHGHRIAHGYEQEQLDWLAAMGHFQHTLLTDEVWWQECRILTAKPDAILAFSLMTAMTITKERPLPVYKRLCRLIGTPIASPTIRKPTLDDTQALGAVHARAWRYGFRDLMPANFLAEKHESNAAARWSDNLQNPKAAFEAYVAELSPWGVCGFVVFGESRDASHPGKEIWAMNLIPEVWGLGVAAPLLAAALASLPANGVQNVHLWALEGNRRARRFYEKAGAYLRPETRLYPVGDVALPEVCMEFKLVNG